MPTSDAFNDETTADCRVGSHDYFAWHKSGEYGSNPATMIPDVYKIALVGEPFSTITTATFQVHVLLSEEPKGGLIADLIEVAEATIDSVVKLASPTVLSQIRLLQSC